MADYTADTNTQPVPVELDNDDKATDLTAGGKIP